MFIRNHKIDKYRTTEARKRGEKRFIIEKVTSAPFVTPWSKRVMNDIIKTDRHELPFQGSILPAIKIFQTSSSESKRDATGHLCRRHGMSFDR